MKWSNGNINHLDIFPASNVAYNDCPLHYSSGAQTKRAAGSSKKQLLWVLCLQLSSDLLGLMSVTGEIPFCFH